MRRTILVGAIVLEKVASGDVQKETLWGWLQAAVTGEEDHRLFEGLNSVKGTEGARSEDKLSTDG